MAETSPSAVGARNVSFLVAFAGLRMALFPIPVITLFWRDEIGMSQTEIMTLQAIFGATSVIFEFPSGYFADRVGHRASLVSGAVLWSIGWGAYAVGTTFGGMVVAEMILGAGLAFMSGADSALLYDSVALAHTPRADDYPRAESRIRAAQQASEAAAASVGGALYETARRLPFFVQVPFAVLSLVVACATKEVRVRQKIAGASHWRRGLALARYALFEHRRLRAALLVAVCLHISTFVIVWFIQPYAQAAGAPLAWLGPMWAGFHLWLAAVSLFAHRALSRWGTHACLLICCILIGVGYATLASVDAWFAPAFYLLLLTARGLQGTVLATAIQKDAPADDRASILSLSALMFRLAFVIIGPPIGWVADHYGLRGAIAASGALLTALSLITWRMHRRADAAFVDQPGV